MAQKVIIPRMGQTMTEGTVAKWCVPDGTAVETGQDVYELEYDKSTATVQAKKAGVLRQLVKDGAVIPVGQPVGVILENGEKLEEVNLQGYEVANSALAGKNPDAPKQAAASPAAAPAAPKDADVIVIGGGPGGYVCALKAAMLGAKVILVERDSVGGTCLNRGCIPTKALLQSAELYEHILEGGKMGINAADVTVDYDKVDAYRGKVVTTLVKGVEGLLKARKVELVRGEASFAAAGTLDVALQDGTKRSLSAPNIVIAAGSRSATPPIPGLNGKNVITSTEALDVKNLPKSMAIIGGGVIGMEIGAVYAAFGVKIVVIEALPRILPNMDEEISAAYTAIAKKKMEIHTSARVSAIEDAAEGKTVRYTENDQEKTADVDVVLVAVGRTPDTASLKLDKAGVAMERAKVVVNDRFETNVPGVYCIGDANARTMLAHVASAQGVAVAEQITGHTPAIAQNIIPSCIYTDPEIAAVGLTEAQVKDSGREYKVGKFSLRANGRSLVVDRPNGFVKIIGDAKTNEVLGVHIIGAFATEMIGECAAVMKLEGCVEDIAHTIHAHPTVGESAMEAAEKYLGGAIHSL